MISLVHISRENGSEFFHTHLEGQTSLFRIGIEAESGYVDVIGVGFVLVSDLVRFLYLRILRVAPYVGGVEKVRALA
jgi:hypothetical protein